MVNGMSLHPYPTGATTGCQISIHKYQEDQDLGCAAVEPKQNYECTCPVCGHARKYKRDQDLSSAVVETRKTSTSAPVQSADRHTSTKLFLNLSEAGGVKQASGRELHEPKLKREREGIYVMRSVVCSRKCSLSDLRW